MAGCNYGFAVSAEFIVSSRDPLDPKLSFMLPDFVKALEDAFMRTTFTVPGEDDRHRILEVHVYRVAPSLSSIRRALGQPTPWIGPGGKVKRTRGARRGARRTSR